MGTVLVMRMALEGISAKSLGISSLQRDRVRARPGWLTGGSLRGAVCDVRGTRVGAGRRAAASPLAFAFTAVLGLGIESQIS